MPAQMLLLLVLLALTIITLAAGQTGYPFPIAKPGCDDKCGNMSIPYPFGQGEGCYLHPTFIVNCMKEIKGEGKPPRNITTTVRAYVMNIEVTEIMLLPGEVRFLLPTTNLCTSEQAGSWDSFDTSPTYALSHLKNKFTVIGCDAIAHFNQLEGSKSVSECSTSCQRLQDVVNGTCNGVGCCQTSVPTKIKGLNITLERYGTTAQVDSSFHPCNSAFVVEQSAYNFNSLDFIFPPWPEKLGRQKKPAIFEWAIRKANNCKFAQDSQGYLCGANSVCVDYDNGPGYRCNCSDGFQGNPYLANGCQGSGSSMLSGSLTRSWIGLLSCVLLLKMLNGGTF